MRTTLTEAGSRDRREDCLLDMPNRPIRSAPPDCRFGWRSLPASLACLLGLLACTPLPAEASEQSKPDADAATIEQLIRAGAADCMLGKPETPLSHFGSDIILSYPGARDQRLDDLTLGYPRLCRAQDGSVENTEPKFEEVVVNGDMALARLIWRTHLRGMPPQTFRYLRDFQVWERRGGQWRFTRGVHFALQPDDPLVKDWPLGRPAR